jgi:hypothetical protein
VIRTSGSVPIALAVYGDPVVGRALALLLRDERYEPKFVPASSLNEPEVWHGVKLLLLTPTPELSPGRREVLLASLRDKVGPVNIPILELVFCHEETRGAQAWDDESVHTVPWPCSIEELRLRIEASLVATTPATY